MAREMKVHYGRSAKANKWKGNNLWWVECESQVVLLYEERERMKSSQYMRVEKMLWARERTPTKCEGKVLKNWGTDSGGE